MNVELLNGVKISYPKDCGNAPKKIVLVGLYKAFAASNYAHIQENTTEDLIWQMIGKEVIEGHDQALEKLKQYREVEGGLKEIAIFNAITHGNVCAVNGKLTFNNSSSFAFCDIFKFRGFSKTAKVKEISSYVIKL